MSNYTEQTEGAITPAKTALYQIGDYLGQKRKETAETLAALDTRLTAAEAAAAATAAATPNAEFFRYAPRVTFLSDNTLGILPGQIALSAHVYDEATGSNYYYHIEDFMCMLAADVAPRVWVSPTSSITLGEFGLPLAHGQFYDESGVYTKVYDMGNVFAAMSGRAAYYATHGSDGTGRRTSMAVIPRAEHPAVRSAGGTCVTTATAKGSDWIYLSGALQTCCSSESGTRMDTTAKGKWAADLMKCWYEKAGTSNSYGAKLIAGWTGYMAATSGLSLRFANRIETTKNTTGKPLTYPAD